MDTHSETPLIRMAKVLWARLGPALGDARAWEDLGDKERGGCIDALARAVYTDDNDLQAIRRVMPGTR